MIKLLTELNQTNQWKSDIKKSARRNKIDLEIASYYTPVKLLSFYDFLKTKNEKDVQSKKKFWIENQQRAFYWILLILSYKHNKLIKHFDENQWTLLQQIFIDKQIKSFKYQTLKLLKSNKTNTQRWNQKQDQELINIIQQKKQSNIQLKKWNDLARQLYLKSDGEFFRTGKQCRQRWLNHLDPSKNRGQWVNHDDYIIMKSIMSIGKKWSQIARMLKNRTQHMVKNRYKSLMIRYKKQYPKNYNQTMIFQQQIRNYQRQNNISQDQNTLNTKKCHKTLQIQTRGQLEKKIKIKGTQNKLERFDSIAIIQEQNQSKNEEQLNDFLDLGSLKDIKQSSRKNVCQMNNQEEFLKHGIEMYQIQSPQIWNHTAKTPGYYGFSPCVANIMSFGQCQSYFFK